MFLFIYNSTMQAGVQVNKTIKSTTLLQIYSLHAVSSCMWPYFLYNQPFATFLFIDHYPSFTFLPSPTHLLSPPFLTVYGGSSLSPLLTLLPYISCRGVNTTVSLQCNTKNKEPHSILKTSTHTVALLQVLSSVARKYTSRYICTLGV